MWMASWHAQGPLDPYPSQDRNHRRPCSEEGVAYDEDVKAARPLHMNQVSYVNDDIVHMQDYRKSSKNSTGAQAFVEVILRA